MTTCQAHKPHFLLFYLFRTGIGWMSAQRYEFFPSYFPFQGYQVQAKQKHVMERVLGSEDQNYSPSPSTKLL